MCVHTPMHVVSCAAGAQPCCAAAAASAWQQCSAVQSRDNLAGSVSSGSNLKEEDMGYEKTCKGVIKPFQLLSAAIPPNSCL